LSKSSYKSGNYVAFQLSDVMCPDLEQLLAQIGPELSVAGEVVMLSDNGEQQEHFAIVNVTGIAMPLIVPVAKLSESQRIGQKDNSASS
jgi:hypothetical protein